MGLSVSDAVRVLLTRVAADQIFPFEIRVPNSKTRAAIAELEQGKARRASNVEMLMVDLNADD